MTIIRINRYFVETCIVVLILLIIIILPSWKFVRYYRLPAEGFNGKSKEAIFISHFGCAVVLSFLTFIWLRNLDFSEAIVIAHEWVAPLSLIALLGLYGLIIGKIIDFFIVRRSDKKKSMKE